MGKWTKTSETLEPTKDKVMPLIESAAADYVKANAGWPKRALRRVVVRVGLATKRYQVAAVERSHYERLCLTAPLIRAGRFVVFYS